jgi:hypothetical protein
VPRRISHLTAPLAVLLLVLWPGTTPAGARDRFRPHVAAGLGLLPAAGSRDIAIGSNYPVVFHGGPVMSPPVTVHTVFWAPSGYSFEGSPGAGVPGYEALVQRFFSDAAADSGLRSNIFSTLNEYPGAASAGGYELRYDPAGDSIDDTDAYPRRSRRCASPDGIATCLTDDELSAELARVIARRDPGGAGLHDVWIVLLPPDVDECLDPGVCGSNAFAGYHSLAGTLVYAVVVDPLIELPPSAGADPEGNPDAESAIDTAAHELVESITDPQGTGWMDPNGYEVADKCENPELGTPLGYAPDGSPFNQLIDGDRWLIQTVWSNAAGGCLQRTSALLARVAAPTVRLRQFSPFVSGSVPDARTGTSVDLGLWRAGRLVAGARGRIRATGAWGPLALRTAGGGALRAVGDDRDVLVVRYGRGGPRPDVIETGSGGNPFTASGWTGWSDLDTGFAVRRRSVAVSPCFQVGVLRLSVGGAPAPPLVEHCNGESGVASVSSGALDSGTRVLLTSLDNRAVSPRNPAGALVALTIALGEPGARAAEGNDEVLLDPSGFPSCTADLRAQALTCSGLVAGERYRIARRRGRTVSSARPVRAGGGGTIRVVDLPGAPRLSGGDLVTLRNPAGRLLTVLHVAHLQVAIEGDRTVISGGRCQPGEYYGPPPRGQPTGPAVLEGGLAGRGRICPLDGSARGLPDGEIEQSDEFSGGLTRTEVPLISSTAPAQDAILYGSFRALAQSALRGAHGGLYARGAPISLFLGRAGSTRTVFRAANVDRPQGVFVPALPAGVYDARWVLRDANGDTRTLITTFVEE